MRPAHRARFGVLIGAGLLFACSRPLWAAPPAPDTDAHASQVLSLLAQWRVSEAESALAPLLAIAPDLPSVQLASASLLFHQGRYRRAQKKLRQVAGTSLGKSPVVLQLAALVKSTAETVEGFKQARSRGGHFLIRHAPGRDALLVPFVGTTLEAARSALETALGHAPREPIVVEIYPRPADLARVSALTEADIRRTGTIALCKYNRLMIVSPGALARGYAWRDTLTHEYTHLVVSQLSHNTVPIWLHEGLAKHFETAWRLPAGQSPLTPAQKHLLSTALRQNSFIPWAKMHPSMAKLPDQRSTALAFAQVQTAVAFLLSGHRMHDRHGTSGHVHAPSTGARGRSAARALLLALRKGASPFEAISKLTGLSRKRFSAAWQQYLRSLDLSRVPRVRWQKLEFHSNTKGHRERAISRIRVDKARRYFRLAEMLRRRHHTRAAVIEYEKAHNLLGQLDPFVGNALARTLLESKQSARATEVLLPVARLYPMLAGVQTTLGVALLAAGKKALAKHHLLAAMAVNPFAPEVHCSLAAIEPKPSSVHARACNLLRGR